MAELRYLQREKKPSLAYRFTPASGPKGKKLPMVMFLGGFKSDMEGTKAAYLEAKCARRGQAYVRFDYTGHGSSEGNFEDGTISFWKEDALDVLDYINPEKVILVGSSMGGWIALLCMLERSEKVAGLVGISAAPDFTSDYYDSQLTPAQQLELENKGRVEVENEYSDEPYVYTRALFEDAEKNYLLNKKNTIEAPIILIQSMQDSEVPWEITSKIQKAFTGDTVDIVLIEDGDHRLSRDGDLLIIDREVQSLSNTRT